MGKKARKGKEIVIWTEESVKAFKRSIEGRLWETEEVQEHRRELRDTVLKSMEKKVIRTEKEKLRTKIWWDRECTQVKRKVKGLYRTWKEGKVKRVDNTESSTRFREMCKEKEEKKQEEELQEITKIANQGDLWKYINKSRKRMTEIFEGIKMVTWKEHFMNLLGSAESHVASKWMDKKERA